VHIGAALRTFPPSIAGAPGKHVLEEIAERGRPLAVRRTRKIEAGEAVGGRFGDQAIGVARVVATTAVGIHQRLIRVEDLAEPRRRLAVARIDIGVISTRKATVRPLDLAGRCAALHSEDDVEVHLEFKVLSSKFKVKILSHFPTSFRAFGRKAAASRRPPRE
jgi:hypothetical protein